MDFLVVMINVFALAAFIVIWLSISFIAFDIYKSNKNMKSAISLARVSNILRNLLIVWFVLLFLSFLINSDSPVWTLLFLALFIGLVFFVYRLYGNILNAVSSIRKDDGSEKSRELIHSSVVRIDRHQQAIRTKKDFSNFSKFFWILNGLITVGVLLNMWLRDSEGAPMLDMVTLSIMLIISLQIMFLPIYYIAKKIIFATLKS